MNNQDIIKKAKEDFKLLKEIINNHKGTFNELCEKLDGFNIQQKLFFDVNFGTIKGMVYYDFQTDKIGLCEEVDIWDESEIINKNYIMEGEK